MQYSDILCCRLSFCDYTSCVLFTFPTEKAERAENPSARDASPTSSGVDSGEHSPVSQENMKNNKSIRKLWGKWVRICGSACLLLTEPLNRITCWGQKIPQKVRVWVKWKPFFCLFFLFTQKSVIFLHDLHFVQCECPDCSRKKKKSFIFKVFIWPHSYFKSG